MKTRFIELHSADDNFPFSVNVQSIILIVPINPKDGAHKERPEANSVIGLPSGDKAYVRETRLEVLSKIKKTQRLNLK